MYDGLIKAIKGYHINFCSSFKSPIENSYDGCIVSPVMVAGGLLFIRVSANHYFLYVLSEDGNENYCCDSHARSGLDLSYDFKKMFESRQQ